MKFIGKTIVHTIFTAFLFILTPEYGVAQVAEPAQGKARPNNSEWVRLTIEEYIMQWRHLAIENMEIYGIPASITMGQAILESGFGNGYLARTANNHFCIKCKSTWEGDRVYHDDDEEGECFRAYPTVADSFHDHAEFLNNGKRYDFLFAYDTDDYKSWAKGLKSAGYATAKDYDARLIRVIEESQLYLLDKKNGLKLYDEYMAKRLGIDTESLAQKYSSKTDALSAPVAPATREPGDVIATAGAYVEGVAYAEDGVNPNRYRVTINSHKGYNVYLANGAHYILAAEGDSFERLGELFDISPATLRKFNDLKGEAQPEAHDVVYIERKSSRWQGEELMHTVVEGETLYDIAQLYGIRLVQLSKMNRLRASENLHAGQTIRIK